MIKKRYLTEVSFINGIDEFKSYRSYSKTVKVKEDTKSLIVELDAQDFKEDSIQVEVIDKYYLQVNWKRVNEGDSIQIELYVNGNDVLLANDSILINYTALNSNVSDLYSIDYEDGVLYLASESNLDITCEYSSYNTLLEGEGSTQLESDEYRTDGSILTINNKLNNYIYKTVYSVEETIDAQYTTPFLSNIKINYLNLNEEESF